MTRHNKNRSAATNLLSELTIRPATIADVPTILAFIRDLAEFEQLTHEVVVDEARLAEQLFGDHPAAEVLLGFTDGEAVSFAIFFQNFSTFLGRPGLYLEDLFVRPHMRGRGIGRDMLIYLARIACERGYGRFEWAVLDWNRPAIDFYRKLGAMPLEEWTVFRLAGAALQRLAQSGDEFPPTGETGLPDEC